MFFGGARSQSGAPPRIIKSFPVARRPQCPRLDSFKLLLFVSRQRDARHAVTRAQCPWMDSFKFHQRDACLGVRKPASLTNPTHHSRPNNAYATNATVA